MTITYTWTFPLFETIPSLNGLENVVTIVHWTYTAQSGGIIVNTYGTFSPPQSDPGMFIPYNSITFNTTINWANSILNVPALQTSLLNQLNQLLSPMVEIGPPPF